MSILTDYMNCVSVFVARNTNQEVVWLDITIDQRFVVDRLHACNLQDGNNRLAPASPSEDVA